jgi:phosphoglycerate dehydrogenase-like enzyme
MTAAKAPRIAIAPAGAPAWLAEAIEAGGAQLSDPADAEALIWGDPRDVSTLGDTLIGNPQLKWVQLPWAGVEAFIDLVDDNRRWTCGKGVYAEPVAEMALTMALVGLRQLNGYVRAKQWSPPAGRNLLGGRVTILGGGGITESLLRLLAPFDAHVTVVRNHVAPMEGADVVVGAEHLHDALPGADVVILALALTPETEGIIGANELAMMESHSWLVNVARGRHVVTDDLVAALMAGNIGGAALDVTDPEPLPTDHPLWSLSNCFITPHIGNTPEMALPLLRERIVTNVRRYVAGDDLIGVIDPELGY